MRIIAKEDSIMKLAAAGKPGERCRREGQAAVGRLCRVGEKCSAQLFDIPEVALPAR